VLERGGSVPREDVQAARVGGATGDLEQLLSPYHFVCVVSAIYWRQLLVMEQEEGHGVEVGGLYRRRSSGEK
jgi:hypothetical protein